MLFEVDPWVDPIKLHYMTDRQERLDLKLNCLNCKYCGNKDTYILDALEVS